MAKRNGVGRPDLPRSLDDGGLVDLNHAPVEVLRDLPGFNEATALQVRERVEQLGPFQSLDEVIVEVGIAPGFEKHLREYALLLP
ncbi:helix-hairpin-helix domain-containing protein [Glycomyces sp. NPDC021274]|uniref:ComEA family DNA-binding protein n=1 Tax=Glycomyces sp. NPDC021274 TaxID=3155120 RepID=UPI0033F0B164